MLDESDDNHDDDDGGDSDDGDVDYDNDDDYDDDYDDNDDDDSGDDDSGDDDYYYYYYYCYYHYGDSAADCDDAITFSWACYFPKLPLKLQYIPKICMRFLLCCALLWLYIDWFSHIHQAYFTGTVEI